MLLAVGTSKLTGGSFALAVGWVWTGIVVQWNGFAKRGI